ncbi:MAG: hypothetical protein S4CHLAM6_12180 [Chlamydiae bacterium]|nr:hypothetical protein [Chlamydiota bacterium]
MPIIWRYIYKQFFKVFLLTTASFILILLVTRLKEIARFVALSPNPKYVFAFILNIIPYILPIALPIAALLSAIVLFQKLSHSHELTALRCAGYSLFSIMFPVLVASLLFSLLNFFIVSELTSYSQVFSRKMVNELITTNPLLMLEHKNKLKKDNLFVDMSILEKGKLAKNLFIITPDKANKHLNLISMDQLAVDDDQLFAPSINIISMMDTSESNSYDHLVIENESNVATSSSDLTKIMHKTHLHLQPHHLSMPYVHIALEVKRKHLQRAIFEDDAIEQKKASDSISDLHSEIVRRISIGLAVFTFTFIGISFSIEIGRTRKKKNLVIISALTIFGLLCFFIGKIFHHQFWLAALVYLIPHVISISYSTWNVTRTMKGIE